MLAVLLLTAELFSPPRKIKTVDWATSELYLPSEGADIAGLYDVYYTPYLVGIFEALDDQDIPEIVVQKAAQIGWTFCLIAYLGRLIVTAPCSIVMMFAKTGDARNFNDEKLVPTIEASPTLNKKIDTSKSRSSGNRADFKRFDGGFLKMVGSNSPGNVKSTPADVVIVEEPDDASLNVNDQGDAITMLWERTKRKRHGKRIMGGTPSVKGLSRVEAHIERSDKRMFYVPCHECGEEHVLAWENVSWLESKDEQHPVYGNAVPETAVYACPDCGVIWDDYQRKENIRKGRWVATAKFHGVAGFMELNELYACLPGATLADLVKDFLTAEHEASTGSENSRIVFQNSKLARPYEFKTNAPDIETLQDKALDYPEMVVPRGGLVLTAGVDVQHNRFAIIIRAWGREEESWLIYWGEIEGNVTDRTDPVWDELGKLLFSPIKHETGAWLKVKSVSMDSSDGNTSDNVYWWIRKMIANGYVFVKAIKGESHNIDREIYSKPKSPVDAKTASASRKTKASKYNLSVYMVGTNKAKDLIASRITFSGSGAARFHYYKSVRVDYFEQLTNEVKAPHRTLRNRLVWQKKAGKCNEALDCEGYALHGARSLSLHRLTPSAWEKLEQQLAQPDMFAPPEVISKETSTSDVKKEVAVKKRMISKGVSL